MRTRLKVITAGIIVAFTLLLPFVGAASATTYVSARACKAGGGIVANGVCNGGRYDGLPIMN